MVPKYLTNLLRSCYSTFYRSIFPPLCNTYACIDIYGNTGCGVFKRGFIKIFLSLLSACRTSGASKNGDYQRGDFPFDVTLLVNFLGSLCMIHVFFVSFL